MPHAYASASLVSGIWSVRLSSWTYYLDHLYAKFRYPPVLLVVCRDKGTAEWAAEPIRIGLEKHPSLAVFPLVRGPPNSPKRAWALPRPVSSGGI